MLKPSFNILSVAPKDFILSINFLFHLSYSLVVFNKFWSNVSSIYFTSLSSFFMSKFSFFSITFLKFCLKDSIYVPASLDYQQKFFYLFSINGALCYFECFHYLTSTIWIVRINRIIEKVLLKKKVVVAIIIDYSLSIMNHIITIFKIICSSLNWVIKFLLIILDGYRGGLPENFCFYE